MELNEAAPENTQETLRLHFPHPFIRSHVGVCTQSSGLPHVRRLTSGLVVEVLAQNTSAMDVGCRLTLRSQSGFSNRYPAAP